MAAIVPVSGHALSVSYTPAGGAATVLKVTGWDFSEEVNAIDVSHTGTAGFRARIANLIDWKANITATVDTALYPWATTTPLIRAGNKGAINITVNSTGPDVYGAVPVIIDRVNFSSRVDGVLTYNFDVSLDNLAENASIVTYPS